jgi:hypothetical protein
MSEQKLLNISIAYLEADNVRIPGTEQLVNFVAGTSWGGAGVQGLEQVDCETVAGSARSTSHCWLHEMDYQSGTFDFAVCESYRFGDAGGHRRYCLVATQPKVAGNESYTKLSRGGKISHCCREMYFIHLQIGLWFSLFGADLKGVGCWERCREHCHPL